MRKLVVAVAAAIVVSASLWLFAATVPQDPPIILPYRGYLEETGQPVNRKVDVAVEIFDGAQSVWQDFFDETHGNAVQVANGNLGLLLGSHKALGPELLVGGRPLDLQITVGGVVLGKQRLHPVAYAVSSANAHHASQEFDVDGGISANQLTLTSNVNGGGGATVGGSLSVTGPVTARNSVELGSDSTLVTVGGNAEVKGELTTEGDSFANSFKAQYDSGWFWIHHNDGEYRVPLAHNLGQAPSQVTLLQCGVINQAKQCIRRVVIAGTRGYSDWATGYTNPASITSDDNYFYVGMISGKWAWGWWNGGGFTCGESDCYQGWYRILAWR